MIGGRFMATKVDPSAPSHISKTVNLSSFFQARLAETPKKPMPLLEPVVLIDTAFNEGAISQQSKENLPEKGQIC